MRQYTNQVPRPAVGRHDDESRMHAELLDALRAITERLEVLVDVADNTASETNNRHP